MKLTWEGHYLDGKTAARYPAVIRLMQTGLEITLEDGRSVLWPYPEIRQTQGYYKGESVRLERGQEIPEALVIDDSAFLVELHRRAPEPAMRFHHPGRRSLRIYLTILAGAGAVGLSIVIYFWGIPALAAWVTPHVPTSWEEQLGKSVAQQLAPPEKQCADPSRTQAMNEIIQRLTTPLSYQPYALRVIVVDKPIVNAFALPGGTIVIFRGLIEKTESAEELAGVLAHELQHVLKRHTTKALLQQASTAVLIAAVTGDVSGAMAYGMESARVMGLLRYNRRSEEEADTEGMRMLLDAKIDSAGMIRFYELLKKEGPELPGLFKYLSTHPATEDRIEKLRLLARQSRHEPDPLLPNRDWKEIREICRVSLQP